MVVNGTPGRILSDTQAVIFHYQTYHKRARPGDKEKKLIKARLNEGYTVEDLQEAIDGNHRSPFHNGENDRNTTYHDLTLIMRNSSKVLQFIELAAKPQRVQNETSIRNRRAGDDVIDGVEIWITNKGKSISPRKRLSG